MKICVIGGTGHIAKFLVPMLVEDGHSVTVVSSGRKPLPRGGAWERVSHQTRPYLRDDDEWQRFIAELGAEVIIDLLGVDLPATYGAGKVSCKHIIACGSLWMLGEPKIIPTPEVTQGPCEFDGYAKRYQEIQGVMEEATRDGIAFTAIFPPNICGPGKIPLETQGGRNVEVHRELIQGGKVYLPQGCNNTIGPCDAQDIAQAFWLAVGQREKATDQIFNVGASYALTVEGFVQAYSAIYQVEIPIEYVNPDVFYKKIIPNPGANYHFRAQMLPDITKISEVLGYRPKYTPEETIERAALWMESQGLI